MPDNPDFDWLTYETVFNQGRFRRPNGQFKTHLYCLPRNELILWFRDGIDDATVQALSAAFFPDETAPLVHRDDADGAWPWKGKGGRRMPPATPLKIPLRSGPGCLLHAPARVVLPYNELDNHSGSLALGTGPVRVPQGGKGQEGIFPDRWSPSPDLLEPQKQHWDMWRTASRSCVMRLKPLEGAWPERWKRSTDPWEFEWVARVRKDDKGTRTRFRQQPSPTVHHLAPAQLRRDFSVKTGVSYVGEECQGVLKERIDGNWIVACLRSDYLHHMKSAAKREGRAEPDLVFLTELLTIAEREERPGDYKDKPPVKSKEKYGWVAWQRDGVQVRDLAPLLEGAAAGRLYFPPLSIPFVGWSEGTIDFATRTDEFKDICNDHWSNFWMAAWASLLGRAKALLLVRYALQSINPHTQNFLLEFERQPARGWVSTGRLIVRDLQDTAIHREAAWALHGKREESEPPAEPDDPANPEHPLCDVFKLEVLNHEFGPARDYAQETGTRIDTTYKFLGTHLLWRLFSQFGKDEHLNKEGERIYAEGNRATVELLVGGRPRAVAAAGGADSILGRLAAKEAARQAEEERQTTFSNRFAHWLEFRNAEWGLAHNRAYLHALEEALGHNFCVDWKTLADPKRPTGSPAEAEAAPVAGGAGAWEGNASEVVHEHLRTRDGQKQIRAYRDRKWKASAPAVTLRVKSGGRACSYRKIALRRLRPDPKEWVDLTNQEGKVFLYQGKAEDYRYRLDLKSAAWFELPRPGVDGTSELVWVAPHPPPPPAAPASAPASASKPAAAPAPPAPAPASRAGLK